MTLQQLPTRIAAVCLALILTHCGSAPAPKPEPVELVTGVGDIELQQAAATPEEAQLLDIGVVVFASAPQQLDDQRYGEGSFYRGQG